MIAALACPGPSLLSTFPHGDRPALVAAVNRAAHAVRCDWWVFLDHGVFERYPLDGPNIFTSGAADYHLRNHNAERWALQSVKLTESLGDFCDLQSPSWSTYSATTALVLLAWLGASEIRVYGADWTPAPDWDGHNDPENRRDAERWDRERALWAAVVDWLDDRGTTVVRVQP